MPRVVYGVLDVHPSHRIEIPKPGRTDGRPDACTLCHVDGVPGGRAGTGPMTAVFAGDPLARAVAADALGRAPAFDPAGRARRLGALLDVMADDRYPAVRHVAWRGLRRMIAPDAAPGTGLAAEYDPSADGPARAQLTARLRRVLGSAASTVEHPAPAGRADTDLEIGE
jgi:hypothetical protein